MNRSRTAPGRGSLLPPLLSLLCALLLVHVSVTTAQDATSAGNQAATLEGSDGIVSVTVGASCVAITGSDGTMSCENGEATTMQMVISPGETFSLNLVSFYPTGSSQAPDPSDPPGGGEGPGNRSPTTRPFRLDATMSRVAAGYDMTPLNIDVPSAYSCLYTSTYEINSNLNGGVVRPGYAEAFIPNADQYRSFYRTARVTNINANTDSPPVSPGPVIPRSSALAVRSWGGGFTPDYQVITDSDYGSACFGFTTVTDIYESRTQLLRGNLTNNIIGQMMFDAPFVSSTFPERSGSGGSFNCQKDFCCGTFDFATSLGHCNDPSFCPERAMHCSSNMPYVGSYTDRRLFFKVNGDIDKYDDDDDDDGCDNVSDEEDSTDADSGGICYSIRSSGGCANQLTAASRLQQALNNCDCTVTATDASGATTAVDYDTCEPLCLAQTRGDALFTGSMNDINLMSKRGNPSRRVNDITDEKDFDDDEDDEIGTQVGDGLGDSGKHCYNICNSESRSYCPEHCQYTYAQDLVGTAGNTEVTGKTNPGCRQLNGQLPVQRPVSIYIDDGDEVGDESSNGMISATCVSNCTATPGCDPVLACVDRFGCVNCDDGDEDDGRRLLTTGPEMINNENAVIIATGYLFSNHLTKGWTHFSDSNGGTRGDPPVAPEDDSYGSLDDDYYCDVTGFGDQSTATSDYATWVARCPAAFCIAPIEYQPDDNYYFDDLNLLPDEYFCPKGMFPEYNEDTTANDVRRICNRPLPQRVVGSTDPDAPYAYDQFPFTVCPLGHPDRIGIIPIDQLRYTQSAGGDDEGDAGIPYRVMAHDTAEAVGELGAYCMPNKVAKTPRYYYNVTITLTDLTPNVDPDDAVQTIVLTPQEDGNGDATTNFFGLSADNTVYAKLLGIKSSSGVIAPDLDATVMLCNATDDGGPGVPSRPYRMAGGGLSVSEASQTSPWLIAATGRSYYWDSTVLVREGATVGPGEPVVYENTNYVGLLPLPEILASMPDAYDVRDLDTITDPDALGIKKGSWWYMLTGGQQAWLGTGVGQLGMRADTYSNDAAAAQVCLGGFCNGVPGWEGNIFTLQQRNRDSGFSNNDDPRLNTQRVQKDSGNAGAYERYLRDVVLKVNTPAMVNGRLHDFLYLDDPESLKQQLVRFGHLPASFFSDSADGLTTSDGRDQAGLPTMFIHDNVLISQDPAFSATNVFERFELSFDNTVLFDASSDLAAGQFVDSPVPICAVGTFSTSGQLTIAAENTGSETASFLVSATCDGSVSAGAPQARTLTPGQTTQFTVVLSHTGPELPSTPYIPDGGNGTESAIDPAIYDFSCTVYLGTPVFPNPELYHYDSVTLNDCKIAAGGDSDTTASLPGGDNQCTSFGIGCPSFGEGDAGPTDQATENTYFSELMGGLLLFALFLAIIACILTYCTSTGYEARKEAELDALATSD